MTEDILTAKIGELEKTVTQEVERLKACEHIAEGLEGWEKLRNECPSTMEVAALRDNFLRQSARIKELGNAVENLRLLCVRIGREPSKNVGEELVAHALRIATECGHGPSILREYTEREIGGGFVVKEKKARKKKEFTITPKPTIPEISIWFWSLCYFAIGEAVTYDGKPAVVTDHKINQYGRISYEVEVEVMGKKFATLEQLLPKGTRCEARPTAGYGKDK